MDIQLITSIIGYGTILAVVELIFTMISMFGAAKAKEAGVFNPVVPIIKFYLLNLLFTGIVIIFCA